MKKIMSCFFFRSGNKYYSQKYRQNSLVVFRTDTYGIIYLFLQFTYLMYSAYLCLLLFFLHYVCYGYAPVPTRIAHPNQSRIQLLRLRSIITVPNAGITVWTFRAYFLHYGKILQLSVLTIICRHGHLPPWQKRKIWH